MKTKRFLSLLMAIVLCLSSVTAFAETVGEAVVETVVPSKEGADNLAEKIVVLPEDDSDGSLNYAERSNWAYWNEGENKAADLFFVCPTVDMGKGGNLVADAENEKYRESFIGAINMELGIYNEDAAVYAPYYRQATFPVYSLDEKEQETYLSFAYEDVKKAFLYYAENADASRPLILAGFSQGADLVLRLMKDLFDEPKYQRRLVAAYCIGWKLTEAEVAQYPHLMPAMGETDTGVVVAFNSEAPEITASLIIGENEKTYAINPLNWKTTSEQADKALNKGACFTEYSGNIKEEIPNLTGAYIDENRGALKVTDIKAEAYPGKLFEDGIYHLYDYQFFYRNLQENVKARLSAYNEKYADRLNVYYNDELMTFDVEPIIEDGRTLVPLRAIFETMGCAVYYSEADGKQLISARRAEDNLLLTIGENKMYFNGEEIPLDVPAKVKDGRTLVPLRAIFETMGCAVYYSEADGKQLISARRAEDNLLLTIGENKMYFNGEEIPLDVPAKVKDGRTLVPLRAISEAFACEVHWYGDTKTIDICSPASAYVVTAHKYTETITDEDGNVLIEVLAYYPVVENPNEIPCFDQINSDYKWELDKFIEEAREKKEDALDLRKERGEDFTPFVYELTYEQTYNIWGYLSFTNHKYVNIGGAHPTKIMESRTYSTSQEVELSVSEILIEQRLGASLVNYVTNLFVEKMKELAPDSADIYTHEYVKDVLGYVQFYLTPNALVLYFNPGELAPYALGVIRAEIPYVPELFHIDMLHDYEEAHVFEYEYDDGYEWKVIAYTEDKLSVTEEYIDYPPEEIPSEYYPVGLHKATVKGIKKGNAALILAHVKKGEGLETATQIYISSFYVDENLMLSLVMEDEGMFLIEK